jgi:nucleoside-diphosphate-sugar epimerase
MNRPDLTDVPVLVTGGAGFIGSHLVDELTRRGARVRVLDNFATGKRENLAHLADRIELLEGDLRDTDACRRAVEGRRHVFHQAALGSVPRSLAEPTQTIDSNTAGTANLLDACRREGVGRVVYASSSSVYGDSTALPKREGEEGRPLSPYALSKRMAEEIAANFATCYGLEVVGLRYFNVYGPRQDPDGPYAAVIPRFFRSLAEDRAPVIHGDGHQSRDFTHVSDVVAANLAALGAPRDCCGRVFNVAPGERTTIGELARAVRESFGGGPEPVHVERRPGDVVHSQADPTAARECLGFEARMHLREGLAASAPYYRAITETAPLTDGPLGGRTP